MKFYTNKLKSADRPKKAFERKKHGTLLCRIESYDSRRFKVTVRDMDGVLYWESKNVPRSEALDLAGVALFVLERLPKSVRESLIVPGANPIAITDSDWDAFRQYLKQGATREERSAV